MMSLTMRMYRGEGDYWRIRAFLSEVLVCNGGGGRAVCVGRVHRLRAVRAVVKGVLRLRRLDEMAKILQRCDVCGQFHVWYVVEDEKLGKLHLCSKCWKSRQEAAGLASSGVGKPIVPRNRAKKPHK
jgi:hypothetical protein